MKILQIFNRYGHMGGEELAVGRITEELTEHHEFRGITFDSHEWIEKTGVFNRFRQLLLMIWNPSSIAKVREQLNEFRPDVILLHNIMPIGSAGLYLFLKGRKVPIIHYVHNFRPFSVSGYCWGGNKLLPQGLNQNFLPEILAGAWQESRSKTAWYGLLIWLLHRAGAFQSIDGWIAISNFMKSSFIEAGIKESRIRVISHSWSPQCSDEELASLADQALDSMFLFLGRLTEEKGLRVLLDAWEDVEKSTDIGRLVIAGDGPLADDVKQRCARMKRATCVGFKGAEDKRQLLRDCSALIVPSIWWEPLGLVLYEAFDYGKPVLAARTGGIVDHVQHEQNGWLHQPGDAHTLGSQILQAIGDPATCKQMGQNGRKLLLERNTQIWIDQFNDFANFIQASSSSEKDRRSQIVDSRSEKPTERSPSPLGDLGDLAVQPSSSSDLRPSDSFLPLITSPSSLITDDCSLITSPSSIDPSHLIGIDGHRPTLQASQEISVPSSPSAVQTSPSSLITDDCSLITSPSSIDPSHLIGIDGHRPTLQASQEISVPSSPSAVQFSSSPSHLSNSSIAPPYGGQVGAPGGHALPSSDSSSSDLRPSTLRPLDREASPPISLSIYLADQNPGYDRSFGISRMTQVILNALQATGRTAIKTISSKTSQQPSDTVEWSHILPWGTRLKWVRLLTDHFHPLFSGGGFNPDLYYFPKGYMPFLSYFCQPSVVTIHDTIIQYDKDHYPEWRPFRDYAYWEMMLKHTLKNAGTILTVSESSKRQITAFMVRHALPKKEIHVTYEPCLYETIPQPIAPAKKNHVIHLASCEPHKRSAHLIRWWHEAESQGRNLPMLHLIGQVPTEAIHLLASARTIVKRPFLEDTALQAAYQEARALILPSEIEGFGLPALEAYYLGTPVCYVKDTSVEEILGVATAKGGFTLDDPDSLWNALDQVMAMSPEETRECGLKLRETYAAEKVAQRMITVFQDEKTGRA